jgi:hypothetical protein
MNEVDLFKLQQELSSLRQNNDSLAERLRARDRADAEAKEAAKPKDNFKLKFAQEMAAKELANHAEEYRLAAWRERKVFLVDHPPEYREGGWPEGHTAETYINRAQGLNAEGTALANEKPAEAEVVKLSPWLEAAIAKAKGGKS